MTEDTDSDNQITSLSIVSHSLLSHATYRLLLQTAILRVILQKPWLGMASNSLTLPGWGSLCFCKKKGESTMHVLKLFCSIILKHLALQSSNHEPPLTITFYGIDMCTLSRATFLEIVSHQCSSNDLPMLSFVSSSHIHCSDISSRSYRVQAVMPSFYYIVLTLGNYLNSTNMFVVLAISVVILLLSVPTSYVINFSVMQHSL